jgi:hypothetical protein
LNVLRTDNAPQYETGASGQARGGWARALSGWSASPIEPGGSTTRRPGSNTTHRERAKREQREAGQTVAEIFDGQHHDVVTRHRKTRFGAPGRRLSLTGRKRTRHPQRTPRDGLENPGAACSGAHAWPRITRFCSPFAASAPRIATVCLRCPRTPSPIGAHPLSTFGDCHPPVHLARQAEGSRWHGLDSSTLEKRKGHGHTVIGVTTRGRYWHNGG